MTAFQIGASAVAAVLLFWVVGAYNRLMRLRTDIVRGFEPVGAQFGQRHRLLQRQVEALLPVLKGAGPRLDALQAANQQVEAACAHARVRPGTVSAITSLRLADDILADARARLPVQTAAGVDLPDLNTQLAGVDSALAFARRQFNDAVTAYNQARRQFPTRLVAAVFGLRPAATL